MQTLILALIVLLLAMCLAALMGYFLGKGQAPALKAERDVLRETVSRREQAFMQAQHERDTARLALTRIESAQQEREASYAAQITTLTQGREALSHQFQALSAQLLESANRNFLAQADARFKQSEAASGAALKSLLEPVAATLKRYEENLTAIEHGRRESYGALSAAVELLHQGQAQVRTETARLVNTLRTDSKARGNWGEQQLKNVLELAGLSEHIDFDREVHTRTDEGAALRPDVIITLPGERKLVIDAKCAFNAYHEAMNATDEAARLLHLKAHVEAIRTHVTQLSDKRYWAQFDDAADFVIMFIPGEHFLAAAYDHDHNLWEWAMTRRVVLASPTNLLAIAKTVALTWRQEKLTKQARAIADTGRELHHRLYTLSEGVTKLGKSLEGANKAYNEFVTRLESRVLTQASKFEALDVATPGEIITPTPLVETSPRPLVKLHSPE